MRKGFVLISTLALIVILSFLILVISRLIYNDTIKSTVYTSSIEKRIELINSIFSNSKILVPFREPIQHAYSLLTQHKKFIEDAKNDNFISKYMKWIGHTEFGPNYIPIHNQNLNFPNNLEINHWIEQWFLTYSDSFQSLKNKKNAHFISYEKLCSTKDYWVQIQKLVNIEKPSDFEFRESKKDIKGNIDSGLKEKVMSLYFELNCLNLN